MAIGTARVGSAATGTNSLSIPEPASLVSGDLIVVLIVDHATSGTGTGPSGFTRGASVAGTTASGRLEMFYGFYQDVGAGPWTFGSRTSRSLGRALAYSGVDGGTPMDVTASSRENASGTYGSSSITPVTDGNEVIALYGQTAAGQTWSSYSVGNSNPSTLTEQIDTAYSSYCSFAAADGNQTTAGATGASTATPNSACANLGILMALRPGAGNISSSDSTESVTLSENLTTNIFIAGIAYETLNFIEVFTSLWEPLVSVSEYTNASIKSNISSSSSDILSISELITPQISVSGTFFETASLTENVGFNITFPSVLVFELATLTEFISTKISVSSTVFDAVSLSELVSLLSSIGVSSFETTTFTESLESSVSGGNISSSVYDTINFIEIFTSLWEPLATISEYINASITLINISASISDVITASDIPTIVSDISIISSDSMTVVEDINASVSSNNLSANTYETVNFVETFTSLWEPLITISEYVSGTVSGNISATVSDNITLTEFPAWNFGIHSSSIVDESLYLREFIAIAWTSWELTASETILLLQKATFIENPSEVGHLTDSVNCGVTSSAPRTIVYENISLIDHIDCGIAESHPEIFAFQKVTLSEYVDCGITSSAPQGIVFQSISLTDSITCNVSSPPPQPSASESLSLVENVTFNSRSAVSSNEIIAFLEYINATIPLNPSVVTDITSLSEFLGFSSVQAITTNELFTLAESITMGMGLGCSAIDSKTISDIVDIGIGSLSVSVNDVLTISESLTENIVLSSSSNDVSTLSEFIAAAITGGNLSVFVSDTLTFEEWASAVGIGGIKGLSYVIPLTGEVGYDVLNKKVVKELDDMMPVSSCIEKIL